MLKELLIKDYSISQKSLEQKILAGSSYQIDNVCIPDDLIRYCKDVLSVVNVVPIIDYHKGLLSSKDKLNRIKSLDFLNYKTIDICTNLFFIKNNMVKDFLKEVDTILGYLKDNKKECRFIIDYALLNSELIKDVATLLKSRGVSTIILSTTEYSDDPVDDRIFNAILSNCGLRCIIANKYLNKNRMDKFKEYKPYGIRCVSIASFSEIVYN